MFDDGLAQGDLSVARQHDLALMANGQDCRRIDVRHPNSHRSADAAAGASRHVTRTAMSSYDGSVDVERRAAFPAAVMTGWQ
jgi:hypothetical protein